MAWDVCGSLSSSGIKMVTMTAGTGGWVKGDALCFESGTVGRLIKHPGSTDTRPILFVAAETVSALGSGAVYPLTPDVLIRGGISGTVYAGVKYNIVASTQLVGAAATQTQARLLYQDEADSAIWYFVATNWGNTVAGA